MGDGAAGGFYPDGSLAIFHKCRPVFAAARIGIQLAHPAGDSATGGVALDVAGAKRLLLFAAGGGQCERSIRSGVRFGGGGFRVASAGLGADWRFVVIDTRGRTIDGEQGEQSSAAVALPGGAAARARFGAAASRVHAGRGSGGDAGLFLADRGFEPETLRRLVRRGSGRRVFIKGARSAEGRE